MLISFKVTNFRSYYNETEISLVASHKEKQFLETNTFETNPSLCNERLLKTSMLIGLNGSGKSNILYLLSYCRYVIKNSARAFSDKRNIFKENPEAFMMFEASKSKPTKFEIEFIYENSDLYIYSFSILNEEISEEYLYHRTAGVQSKLSKLKCLFRRKQEDFESISEEFNKLKSFFDIKPSVLFLSYCTSDIKEDICINGKKVINWFEDLNFLSSRINSLDIFESNSKYLLQAKEILRSTDQSLNNLEIIKTKLNVPLDKQDDTKTIIKALKKANIDIESGVISVLEDGIYALDITVDYNLYKDENGELLEEDGIKYSVFASDSKISTGHSKLIVYLAHILMVLQEGGILFLDELDCNLHHQFPKLIIDAFHDNEINKNKAQLIFTTHSANLLDNCFRFDQINVITKDKFGISSISKLSRGDSRIKSTNRLSSMWLANELNNISTITVNDLRKIIN